jgi:RNA polymerase-associated protein RTF1
MFLTLGPPSMPNNIRSLSLPDFDAEELYESPEDRERLMGMPETKREDILYQRHLQLKKFREKKELEEKVQRLGTKSQQPSATEREATKLEPEGSYFEDFSSCIVTRDMCVENAFKPFFEDFIGHFVRARINGLYMVAKIVGVSKGRSYQVPLRKHKIFINRYLSLSTGTRSYENFQLENVSNSPLLEEEYEDVWRSFKIGNMSKIKAKYAQLVRTMSRRLTDDEITKMVANKSEVQPKRKSMTLLKIELIQRRDRAMEGKDQRTAIECQKMIEEIEDNEGNKDYVPCFGMIDGDESSGRIKQRRDC